MKSIIKYSIPLLCAISLPYSVHADRLTLPLDGDNWYLWKDKNASWQDDPLFLPVDITDINLLPVNPPTGGWDSLISGGDALHVSVPGTVEEYLTTSDSPSPDDSKGVSWWWREFTVPADQKGKRVILDFESVRMRAEVFVDEHLAGYDLIGETPFSVDITDLVTPGKPQRLAIRVTNPGGNFHWQDFDRMQWGKYTIQPARGFSGMIGRVRLKSVDPVSVADIYMQNTPIPTEVNAIVTIENTKGKKIKTDMTVSVYDKNEADKPVFSKTLKNITLETGENTRSIPISIPDARLWDPDTPALYTCKVSLGPEKHHADSDTKTFGFRSFTIEGIGENAVVRLNGKRKMLRSAISWGYFPVQGLAASPEMARKQISTAKDLGLNMLNFHRSIGSPVVLEHADEMGLLYYEEPGSFHSGNHDPFLRAILNEKIRRMVKRDRSHPSLVIFNLINEFGGILSQDSALVAKRMDDMRAAHSVDPSRVMTFTSGWASTKDKEEDSKAHMLPFDTTLHRKGWWDNHRAGGPATWEEAYYKSPTDNIMYSDNREEIYVRGEEGAISTPPRIELINETIDASGKTGWDGLFWKKQYQRFADYFNEKNLYPYFGSLDSLTRSMGDVSFEHQGRRIQAMRMQDIGDAYMVNGWESMPYDNHSGIVDIYRNPKGNKEILAYYNQPLYVAVAARNQIVKIPGEAGVDFYIVNEKDLKGDYVLEGYAVTPDGNKTASFSKNVNIEGGDRFGQLLVEDIRIPIDATDGMYKVVATLMDASGKTVAAGHDDVLGLTWNPKELEGNGAIYGVDNDPVAVFYQEATGKTLPEYSSALHDLDWIVVNRPSLDDPTPVPDFLFTDEDGNPTLHATWFSDSELTNAAGENFTSNISRSFVEGAQPDPSVSANQPFSVLWEGEIIPRKSGQYLLGVESNRGVRMHIDGEQLIDEYHNNEPFIQTRPVVMEAGKPIHLRLLYRQVPSSGYITLKWSQPDAVAIAPESIMEKVKNEGTTLILLGSTETWMKPVTAYTGIGYDGYYRVGKDWVGGIHFVKDHPLFDGLPVNTALNWPYQAVVKDGENRFSFRMHGEEMVAGSYKSWPFELGSAVGVIPCGKGKIIFSTLDIANNLNNADPTSETARKLFINFIKFANK